MTILEPTPREWQVQRQVKAELKELSLGLDEHTLYTIGCVVITVMMATRAMPDKPPSGTP